MDSIYYNKEAFDFIMIKLLKIVVCVMNDVLGGRQAGGLHDGKRLPPPIKIHRNDYHFRCDFIVFERWILINEID